MTRFPTPSPNAPRRRSPLRGVLARLGLGLVLVAGPASAQAPTNPSEATAIPDSRVTPGGVPDVMRVTARRRDEALPDVPASVSVVRAEEIQGARPQLGLDEALVRVPGLFLQNRYNFSQDLRVSVRGFGARSAFGIRGVKVFVDGIPATLPDGQAGVDAIDLGSAGRVEVLRGPSSALYGAASGGVLAIESERPPERAFVEARAAVGANGFGKHQVKTGGRAGAFGWLLNGAHFSLDGHREHAKARATSLNGRVTWEPSADERLAVVFNATDSPWAGDPGALTREDSRRDPRAAWTSNLAYRAGERLDQQRLGVRYERRLGEDHRLSARAYAVTRDFANRLPFEPGGQVRLDRFFGGGGAQYDWEPDGPWALAVGVDVDAQRDERRRFDNVLGERGTLRLDQHEDVTSLGVFGLARLALAPGLEASVGGRWDRVRFEIEDDFLSDGDGSDEISFQRFSPSASLLWQAGPRLSVWAAVSTSFETPTTTEFASPTGGGFNGALEEQTATSVELGLRGSGERNLRYELVVYRIDLEDELVPFELASQPGRRFFRNSGESKREGLELSASFEPLPGVRTLVAYTYSDFTFERYRTPGGVFDGHRLPGVPKDQLFAEIAYRHESGFALAWEILWADDFFVDDANTQLSREVLTSSLRASHRFTLGDFELEPFLGVQNLFDADYDANVRINAFGGRFYEPAPDRTLYGGLRVRFAF